MGRRTVLLIVAALVAVLGTAMVYLYVQSADNRAQEEQEPVEVLKAIAQIEPGETLTQAQANGKIQRQTVPLSQVLPDTLSTVADRGEDVALTTIFAGEQITSAKFGSPGEQDLLQIPKSNVAISVNLTDTGRVAGFVAPGSQVAIWLTGEDTGTGEAFTRLVLPDVTVIAVAQTTVTTSTTTSEGGAQTTEQLPRTLMTLSVSQEEAEKVLFAARTGELAFGLRSKDSQVQAGPGMSFDRLFR